MKTRLYWQFASRLTLTCTFFPQTKNGRDPTVCFDIARQCFLYKSLSIVLLKRGFENLTRKRRRITRSSMSKTTAGRQHVHYFETEIWPINMSAVPADLCSDRPVKHTVTLKLESRMKEFRKNIHIIPFVFYVCSLEINLTRKLS